jgi:hypothetical protein
LEHNISNNKPEELETGKNISQEIMQNLISLLLLKVSTTEGEDIHF